jgi:uroporphyrinogen-III synthase
VPAPAQGALALQIRSEDQELKNILAALHHPVDASCIEIERKLLENLEGGCSLPFGAYCQKEHQTYKLWLSYAQKDKQIYSKPLRFFLQDKDPEVLIQRALEYLKKKNIPFIPTVFVSRERSEIELLEDYLGAFNVEIVAKKLIETIPVPFSIVQDSDWIFFNSKTAVRYFFSKQAALKANIRFAVLGEATQRALQQKGHPVHFIGQHADIKKVARDFRKLIEEEKKMQIVLFPQSNISLRTVQEELSFAAKTIDLIVYRTKNYIYEEQILDADYYIFTSPSNVESFFAQKGNIDKRKQKMVAIGKTTYETIKDKGIMHVLLSEKNSELGILNAVLTDIYSI